MKRLRQISILLLFLIGSLGFSQNTDDQRIIDKAERAKEKLMSMDNGLGTFFEKSAGFVLFPNVGKGGFIIGAAAGNGVVYENGKIIGMAKLKKLDIGLQAGGKVVTEIIFFEKQKDLNEFKEGEFQFSAGASAVALKSGVAVSAKYKDGVAVFTLPKEGLMADASVGGQKFSYAPL